MPPLVAGEARYPTYVRLIYFIVNSSLGIVPPVGRALMGTHAWLALSLTRRARARLA